MAIEWQRWPAALRMALLIAASMLGWRLLLVAPQYAYDDTYQMYLAANVDWHKFLWLPEFCQRISTAHLTPFTVPWYAFVLWLVGVSPSGHLLLHLTLFGVCLWSISLLLLRRFQLTFPYLMLFVALVFSLAYSGSLLTRFYTAHYLLGGIASAWALIWLGNWQYSQRGYAFLTMGALLWLALLSKEVFVGMPLVALLLVWPEVRLRRPMLMLALLLWGAYLGYRGVMLGSLFGGREAHQAPLELLSQIVDALPVFAVFYLRTHAVLLLLLVYAIFLAPRLALSGILVALILLVPSAGAPHAFMQPELHADRLLVAGDMVLAATVALCFAHGRFRSTNVGVSLLVALLSVGVGWSLYLAIRDQRQVAVSGDWQMTQTILTARPLPRGVYLPREYNKGAVIAVYAERSSRPFPVSSNCLQALAWTGSGILYFNSAGQLISRTELARQCIASTPAELPAGEVLFHRGVLSWHLRGYSAGEVGVYFPAYALAVALSDYEQRVVRPALDEPYQLYWRHGNSWWFSAPRTVRFE